LPHDAKEEMKLMTSSHLGEKATGCDDLAPRQQLAPAINHHQLRQASASPAELGPLVEPLSNSEMRVLKYLPTHLSMGQIAGELYVSLNTVRTHMRSVYAKLGTHRRAETVDRARALGLLAPAYSHQLCEICSFSGAPECRQVSIPDERGLPAQLLSVSQALGSHAVWFADC
jgi:DNA-binding CsgD family transcriptional regulator